MIALKNVTLTYGKEPHTTTGLNNVSLDLPDKGLVVILGKTGSGKTSLMRVLGAISKPQEGSFFVDDKDMLSVKEGDLNSYRCTYISNILEDQKLIEYQTVAQNTSVPLKLAGYKTSHVNERVKDILHRADLEDVAKVRVNELGGGLKQAVNIARALGSDFEVLLADEPFADLNPEDRSRAMSLLKEASKEGLVVLATSDADLAQQYSDRIITMADGAIVSDVMQPRGAVNAAANPVIPVMPSASNAQRPAKPRLRLGQAIGMAASYMTTKKGRTFLNSLVGAIAVMALGLVIMTDQGMDAVYENVEGDLMDMAPITLQSSTLNTEVLSGNTQGSDTYDKTVDKDVLEKLKDGQFATDNQVAASVKPVETNIKITKTNDLAAFKSYMDSHSSEIYPKTTAVEYTYSQVTPQVYRLTDNGTKALKMNCTLADIGQFSQITSAIASSLTSTRWYQMPDSQRIREANYTLEAGSWPTQANEVALVLNNNRTISDFTLYTLGLMDLNEMNEIIAAVERGETPNNATRVFSYNDALGIEASVLSNANLYRQLSTGIWVEESADNTFMVNQIKTEGQPVRITGVLRLKEGSSQSSGIAYTGALTDQLIQQAENTAIARQQKANPNVSVFTGQPFESASSTSQVSATIPSSEGGVNASYAPESQTGKTPFTTAVYNPQTQGQVFQTTNPLDVTDPAPKDTATVRFLDYKNNPIKVVQVPIGKTIPAADIPADQARESDDNFDYYFIGWRDLTTGEVCVEKSQFPVVTENVDYIAFYYADHSHYFDPATMTIADMAVMLHVSEDELWDYVWENVDLKELEDLLQMSDEQILRRILDSITTEELAEALGIDPSELAGISLPDIDPQELSKLLNMDIGEIVEKIFESFDLGKFLSMLGIDLENMNFTLDWLSDLLGVDIEGIISSIGGFFSPDSIRTMLAQFSLGAPQDYASAMNKLGIQSRNNPSSISIYSPTYRDRVAVTDFIAKYNAQASSEEMTVGYTDTFAALYNVVDVVGKVISCIVIISLCCALFMFTMMVIRTALSSLIKRKQETSILRALGASRPEVLKLFNAGSILEGLIAGGLGVVLALIISIALDGVIEKAIGLQNLFILTPQVALIMMLISVVITFFAGFIPASLASWKDIEESL